MVGRYATLGMGLDGAFRTSRAGNIAGHAQRLGHKWYFQEFSGSRGL